MPIDVGEEQRACIATQDSLIERLPKVLNCPPFPYHSLPQFTHPSFDSLWKKLWKYLTI